MIELPLQEKFEALISELNTLKSIAQITEENSKYSGDVIRKADTILQSVSTTYNEVFTEYSKMAYSISDTAEKLDTGIVQWDSAIQLGINKLDENQDAWQKRSTDAIQEANSHLIKSNELVINSLSGNISKELLGNHMSSQKQLTELIDDNLQIIRDLKTNISQSLQKSSQESAKQIMDVHGEIERTFIEELSKVTEQTRALCKQQIVVEKSIAQQTKTNAIQQRAMDQSIAEQNKLLVAQHQLLEQKILSLSLNQEKFNKRQNHIFNIITGVVTLGLIVGLGLAFVLFKEMR